MMRHVCFVRLLAALLLMLSGSVSAWAVDAPLSQGVSKEQPVMLTALEVGYDEPHAIATAIGNVEVVQGDTILLADRVTYNQNTDVVHASGHVSVLEPTGDVFFSDDAILKEKMQKGIVQQFRSRLADNSVFAAREGRKLSRNITLMKDAVYSPCKICQPKPDGDSPAPMWQVKATKVTVDENDQRVYYNNAFMEAFGVPVLYSPYFSHPTPDAPSQTGLLTPEYFHATDLGNVVKEPVYVSIAPNMDATLTPWYLSGEKPLLEGEFRHLTSLGYYELRGAITDTYNRDDSGNVIPGYEARGYIEAHGKLQLSEHWDVGLDAERTTDDTFLQLYRFGWQDMLTSRLYAERIQDRDYAVVETMAFQGLQAQDVNTQSPYILPQASLHYETDPGIAHSRFTVDSSALVLERSSGDSDQRVSSTVGWKLPYVTHNGQVIETNFTLRGDAYNFNDLTNQATNIAYSGDTGRVIPQAELNWRYPFINRFSPGHSLTIAPVVELVASPNFHNSTNIPNEDSQIAELSDINLFSADRFTGLDQIESGLRATYGMRGQLQLADDKRIDWLFGQAYQANDQSPFPIASAIGDNYSDYIGRLDFKYQWIDVAYDFRLDRNSFAPISNEVTTNFSLKPLNIDATYIALKNEPLFGDRREVFGNATLAVTDNWNLTLGGRRDLGSTEETPENTALPVSLTNPLVPSTGTVGINSGIVYHNECINVTTSVGRSYINQQDVKPSTTFGIVVTLKNFGNTESSPTAPNTTGAGNLTPAGTVSTSGQLNPSTNGATSGSSNLAITPISATATGSTY